MTIPIVPIQHLGQIHSPFSGEPADGDDGPNEEDPSLLFIYYGMAGDYSYVSPRLRESGSEAFPNDQGMDPLDLAGKLEIPNSFILEVDTEWNGVNYYGFAPAPSDT